MLKRLFRGREQEIVPPQPANNESEPQPEVVTIKSRKKVGFWLNTDGIYHFQVLAADCDTLGNYALAAWELSKMKQTPIVFEYQSKQVFIDAINPANPTISSTEPGWGPIIQAALNADEQTKQQGVDKWLVENQNAREKAQEIVADIKELIGFNDLISFILNMILPNANSSTSNQSDKFQSIRFKIGWLADTLYHENLLLGVLDFDEAQEYILKHLHTKLSSVN